MIEDSRTVAGCKWMLVLAKLFNIALIVLCNEIRLHPEPPPILVDTSADMWLEKALLPG